METKKYIELKDLEVYQLTRELSHLSWEVFEALNYEFKKLMGDQFIRSIDSIGANIAEGYGRYHYRDKVRFYYIARASINEAIIHWSELLMERKAITQEQFQSLKQIANKLEVKLNNFISVTLKKVQ